MQNHSRYIIINLPGIDNYFSKNLHSQQWDAPNGWAPLQWITIQGLINYHHIELANDLSIKWVNLNSKVNENTGKMMEKYNVVSTDLEAVVGEYPAQDGFGWTNGVFLALKQEKK